MTTRQGFTRQMTKGSETRTFTTFFERGSGFKMKCFTTWKGEDSGELTWSNQKWFSSEQECWSEMELLFAECENLGWK